MNKKSDVKQYVIGSLLAGTLSAVCLAGMKKIDRKMQKKNVVTLLDVRDRESYQKGHIPGAVWIPFEDNPDFMSQVPKYTILILYCYRGNLSMKVTGILRQAGYPAYSLAGGYENFRQQTGKKE